MEWRPVVFLYLIETFLEFDDPASLQKCFLCSESEKKFTLAHEVMILLRRKLHLSDLLSEFTVLKFLLHQPRQVSPYLCLCFWAEFSIYIS